MSGSNIAYALARWSKLKTGAASADSSQTSLPGAEPGKTASESSEMLAGGLSSADVDALDAASDFARFLDAGVPQELRIEALRKLWASDPLLTHCDGLIDYARDYSSSQAPAGSVAETAYKVGRGLLDEEEAARWLDLPGKDDAAGGTT